MKDYLETNGPWSQLVELGNIEVKGFETEEEGDKIFEIPVSLNDNLSIGVNPVAHRDEFSETVMHFILNKKNRSAVVFLPDIDEWQEFGKDQNSLQWLIGQKEVRYAFLDATFYDDNELPGRDMSKIPHPRVTETMDLIEATSDESLKDKVRFIHINHTNPLRDKNSPQYKEMTDRGFKLAYRGERFCL